MASLEEPEPASALGAGARSRDPELFGAGPRANGDILSIGDVRIDGKKLEILATALHLTQGQRDGLFFFKLGPLSAN